MSEEDDDDGWEDPEPVIEVRKISIEVRTVSRAQLATIEEALTVCLDRKMDKLNLLLKQMDVYLVGDNLIVNDRFSTAHDFEETVRAFGTDIKSVTVPNLRGKTYVMSDRIAQLLRVSGEEYAWDKAVRLKKARFDADALEGQLFRYGEIRERYDGELRDFLRQVKGTGSVSVTGTETLIDGRSQGVVSDRARVERKLSAYLADVRREACENNRQLQRGTAMLLRERARQMGYSVTQEEKDGKIQLVMVRIG